MTTLILKSGISVTGNLLKYTISYPIPDLNKNLYFKKILSQLACSLKCEEPSVQDHDGWFSEIIIEVFSLAQKSHFMHDLRFKLKVQDSSRTLPQSTQVLFLSHQPYPPVPISPLFVVLQTNGSPLNSLCMPSLFSCRNSAHSFSLCYFSRSSHSQLTVVSAFCSKLGSELPLLVLSLASKFAHCSVFHP